MARSDRGLLSLAERRIGAPGEARPPARTQGGYEEEKLRAIITHGRSVCAPITAADGTKLSAEVHEPQTGRTRGAIIFVHGFGGNKGENGLFHALAARCVEDGFVAVLYDWRGIADSDGDFPTSTLEDHKSDFERVIQWVSSRFAMSRGSLHAVGFSLGAAVIGLALQRQHNLTSVAFLSPASRPKESMWPRYEALWDQVKAHGDIQKPGSDIRLGRPILESLRDTDLGPRAFDLEVPLLVCHGTADARVDYTHTEELLARLDGECDTVRHIKFPGASHSFRPADTCWDRLADHLAEWFGEAAHSSTLSRAHDGERRH
jgi:alpha-beta hydrolase superfamily lysophospholipase